MQDGQLVRRPRETLFKLLGRFESTFKGKPYLHRNANIGNRIADYLYEDLHEVGLSTKYVKRVEEASRVLNPKNVSPGIRGRRGDGSFGEIVPGVIATTAPGLVVARGPTANIEMGAEVKILAKAMIKQIDRVINDLGNQARQFKHKSPQAITVGIVGVNWAKAYTSFEGDRSYSTDGKKSPHPAQEAEIAERRLANDAAPHYDEFVILRFEASNKIPYPFKWRSAKGTGEDYGAMLVRVSRLYDSRF